MRGEDRSQSGEGAAAAPSVRSESEKGSPKTGMQQCQIPAVTCPGWSLARNPKYLGREAGLPPFQAAFVYVGAAFQAESQMAVRIPRERW